ncbi:hypothetical protein [Flavobacterium lacisediminis]|uniref:Lipoprotein n=1 Tax=Flavobacterium lacisediminis TaxID=2989705 RepID=A0ABT3EKU0_9FLAO|nr:hypothetical protein [Flavobacterium lacisediminis]MCW1149192.1 hypothetical protein [Flavobacterium lacisediminis]
MLKIKILFIYFVLLSSISCNKLDHSENKLILVNKFKSWQKEQIKMGKYLNAERCNLSYFTDNDLEVTKSLPTIGFPSDSLIKYHFADINEDDMLDAIVVYNIVSCDAAAALNNAQNEIVILSNNNKDYTITEDFFLKIRDKIGYGNLYVDSLKNNVAYATYLEHLDYDPRCCPSYIRKVEIDMNTKDYILK